MSPRKGIVVLVCGGRDFTDQRAVSRALNKLHILNTVVRVVQGGAAGADECARRWAQDQEVLCDEYPAEWKRLGPAAGPHRNQNMLEHAKPDCVLAFPGGRGTADMIRRAQWAGVLVIPSEVLV
jgi:hypothetical protein